MTTPDCKFLTSFRTFRDSYMSYGMNEPLKTLVTELTRLNIDVDNVDDLDRLQLCANPERINPDGYVCPIDQAIQQGLPVTTCSFMQSRPQR